MSPDLWIVVTVAAAFFQTLRFMVQKFLAAATLSSTGATFARFLYSAPLIAVLLGGYLLVMDHPVPVVRSVFWFFCAIGGIAQVLATVCIVHLFKMRNFAVGITLMKTEVILSVLAGLIILGEGVSLWAFAAIAFGLFGVLLLSSTPGSRGFDLRAALNGAMALGLVAGALFAISGVCYRGASLAVDAADPLIRAGTTLSTVTMMQMFGMALWLMLREPTQIGAVWRARRIAVWIGLLSMAGSLGWFTAFTLQTAAYVKAVGQLELVLSLVASVVFFREKITLRELAGMAILCVSILGLILAV